jgi:hypothetical protein
VLCVSKTCLLLGTLPLLYAFPLRAQTGSAYNQQVTVSVYDDVGISTSALAQAEHKAARIFANAGLDVVWNNCSSSTSDIGEDVLVRGGEQSSPGSVLERGAGLNPAGQVGTPAPAPRGSDCGWLEWPTHLAVRIVRQSRHWPHEVFGLAFLSAEGTGCYSDVFYDRATELQSAWNVDLSDILGNVMAHELGHLLLGSNAHASAGIMQARWKDEELNRMVRGNLLFTAEQANNMRAKLTAVRSTVAATAWASY